MPLDESDLKYIWDMVEEARLVVEFTKGESFESFLHDKKTQRATERSVEIIGEAARNVSDRAREQLPHVQWGAIVATRHILAHEYGEVEREKIWRIAIVHVPPLIEQLSPVLEANPPGPESGGDLAEP